MIFMGEPSGEVAVPPQALETKGADSNFGLSVNGSQLAALIYLQDLKARWVVDPPERFNSLKNFIQNGKMKEANSLLLGQDGFLPERFRSPHYEDTVKGIKDSLSRDVDIKEVMEKFYYIHQPWHLNEFIYSLRGKPLSALPKKDMEIFLPQLGISAHLFPTENVLTLMPPPVDLPTNQQHPYYIEQKEVFGEKGNGNTLSILELFAELAKRYPNVFTHVIEQSHLPSIIMSGHLGSQFGLREHESKDRFLF